MIALIITNDKRIYYSYIFAIKSSRENPDIITYDKDKKVFDLIKPYDFDSLVNSKVYFLDSNTDGWTDPPSIMSRTYYKEFRGYEWLVKNEKLLTRIKKRRRIHKKYHLMALEINSNVQVEEWFYVKSEEDIKRLLKFSKNFYFSNIIVISKDENSITVHIKCIWEAFPELVFEGDCLYNLTSEHEKNFIFNYSFFFSDGYIYFVNDAIKNPSLLNDKQVYFRAKSLRWRIKLSDKVLNK